MASITIRNLDESVKDRLRIVAARHGCSMEEEVRRILRRVLLADSVGEGLGSRIHERFQKLGGVNLPEQRRIKPRPAPGFDDGTA